MSAKRPAEDASLPPQQSVKRASVESAGPRRSSQVLFEGCSLKAAFRGGGGMLGRGFDGMQTTTGLRTAECCDGHNLAAASWHVSLDRHNSRGSDASSPSRFTPPARCHTQVQHYLGFVAILCIALTLACTCAANVLRCTSVG